MSRQYPGLCIGGPLDGQRVVSQTQRLYGEERPAGLGISEGPPSEIPATMSIKRVAYNWLHVGGFALWILEGQTLEQAVKEMALAYERERGK